MNPISQTFLNLLNENLGNRLTPALANGMLLELEKVISQLDEAAKQLNKEEIPNE